MHPPPPFSSESVAPSENMTQDLLGIELSCKSPYSLAIAECYEGRGPLAPNTGCVLGDKQGSRDQGARGVYRAMGDGNRRLWGVAAGSASGEFALGTMALPS